MSREKEFDTILDECLERVFRGESIDACLADYPGHADELRPLLEVVMDTREATDISPSPEFRERAGREFQDAIREMAPAPRRGLFAGLKPVWVSLVALVVVIFAGGGTTVALAGSALPDSPLYGVKLATESVRLAFTFSDTGKAELYAQFAGERVNEIVRLAEKGDLDQVEQATERMNGHLLAMADLIVPGGTLQASMAESDSVFAPIPTPAPMPTATPTPTTKIGESPDMSLGAPTPEDGLTPAPAPATMAPPRSDQLPITVPSFSADSDTVNRGEGDAGLRDKLARQANESIQELLDLLETAPEALRPAIIEAIRILAEQYGIVINYLE